MVQSKSVLSLLLIVLLLLGGVAQFSAQSSEQVAAPLQVGECYQPNEPARQFVPGRLLVHWRPGSETAGMRFCEGMGLVQPVSRSTAFLPPGVQVWHSAEGGEMSAVEAIRLSGLALWAEPDYIMTALDGAAASPVNTAQVRGASPLEYALHRASTDPNDPLWSQQWDMQRLRLPEAWPISSGQGVLVAVVDTGGDFAHPDLFGQLIKGWDYINEDPDPADDMGHGTHVAGTIAALTDNALGVASMAPASKILVVKGLDDWGSGSDYTVGQGIRYAADNGAQVINLSLGGSAYSAFMQECIDYAYGLGVVIVAAAGNSNSSDPMYPAACRGVIAVAATDQADQKAVFSNYGGHISLAAPGVGIWSTMLGGDYVAWNGTSMATPHVAALAALLLAQDPGRNNAQVRAIMECTALDLGTPGWDKYFGWGRLNVLASLDYVPGPTATPTAPTGPTRPPTPTMTPAPAQPSAFELEMFRLTNEARIANGVAALTWSNELWCAAHNHSLDMAVHDCFSHYGCLDNSSPWQRMQDCGCALTGGAGENIAAGFSTPADAVDGLLASPDHRANMLNPDHKLGGMGYYAQDGSTYYHYWTQDFTGGCITVPTVTPTQPVSPLPTPTRTATPRPPFTSTATATPLIPTATATATPRPLLTPTVTMQPPNPTPPDNLLLIRNGGFEEDWRSWEHTAYTAISWNPVHGGQKAAMIGTQGGPEPQALAYAQQLVLIPAGLGVTKATLSWWAYPTSWDRWPYDWQAVQVVDADGVTVLATLWQRCEDTWIWAYHTADLTPWIGRSIYVRFAVRQDGWGDPTAMYVDGVYLDMGLFPSPTPSGTPAFATPTPTVTSAPPLTLTPTATPRLTSTPTPTCCMCWCCQTPTPAAP